MAPARRWLWALPLQLLAVALAAAAATPPANGSSSSDASRLRELQRLEEIENKYKSVWALNDSTYYSLLLVYGLFMLFGSTCNALICLTVILRPRILSARNIFIVNLAASDLLLCVFTMPFSFMEISMKVWTMGVLPCKLVASLQATSIFVSTISITAIALDRYKVIVYPTHQERPHGARGAALLLAGVWLGALALSVPLFSVRTVTQLEVPRSHSRAPDGSLQIRMASIELCVENWPLVHGRGLYSAMSMVMQYVLPITIVSLVYAKISHKLHKRLIRRQRSTQLECQQKRQLNLIRRTHRMLVSVSLIFGLSWLPLNLLNLLGDLTSIFGETSEQQLLYRQVFAVCHLMGCSCACSNPILYAFLNENFRKEFRQCYQDCLASAWRLACCCCGARYAHARADASWRPARRPSQRPAEPNNELEQPPDGKAREAPSSSSTASTSSSTASTTMGARKSALELEARALARRHSNCRLLRLLCVCLPSADSLDEPSAGSCDSNLDAKPKGGQPRAEGVQLSRLRLSRRGTGSATKLAVQLASGGAADASLAEAACSCECHQEPPSAPPVTPAEGGSPTGSGGKRVLLRVAADASVCDLDAPTTTRAADDEAATPSHKRHVIVNVRHCNLCRPSAFCGPNEASGGADQGGQQQMIKNAHFPDGLGLPIDVGGDSRPGEHPAAPCSVPSCYLSVSMAPEGRQRQRKRQGSERRSRCESPSRERCTSIVSIEQAPPGAPVASDTTCSASVQPAPTCCPQGEPTSESGAPACPGCEQGGQGCPKARRPAAKSDSSGSLSCSSYSVSVSSASGVARSGSACGSASSGSSCLSARSSAASMSVCTCGHNLPQSLV